MGEEVAAGTAWAAAGIALGAVGIAWEAGRVGCSSPDRGPAQGRSCVQLHIGSGEDKHLEAAGARHLGSTRWRTWCVWTCGVAMRREQMVAKGAR